MQLHHTCRKEMKRLRTHVYRHVKRFSCEICNRNSTQWQNEVSSDDLQIGQSLNSNVTNAENICRFEQWLSCTFAYSKMRFGKICSTSSEWKKLFLNLNANFIVQYLYIRRSCTRQIYSTKEFTCSFVTKNFEVERDDEKKLLLVCQMNICTWKCDTKR